LGALAEKSIDAAKATAEMGKAWKEAVPKLAQLKDLDEIDSFLSALSN
jgi:phage terminase small subunit